MRILTQKISIFSILAFGLFLLIPSVQRWYLLILLGLGAALILVQERKIAFTKTALINSALYLAYLFSLLFSYHPEDAVKRLETALPLVAIPVIFSVFFAGNRSLFSEKIQLKFGKIIFTSSVVYSVLIYVYFAQLGYFNGSQNYEFCMSQLGRKMPFLNDHPIYLSMPMGISVLFAMNYLKNEGRKGIEYILAIVLTIFLLFTIFFLARKGVIAALIISMFLLLVLNFKSKKKTILISLISLVVISILFIFMPVNQKRLGELFKPETYLQRNETNSTNNRIQIYECAYKSIKQKPLFGYGIGRDRKVLFNCYKENLYYLYENRYNTHNQYLSISMKIGLLGLLVFLLMLCFNFKLAYKKNDWLYFSLLLFFTVIMLSENILERQNGVILFSFLVNFFAFKNTDSIPDPLSRSLDSA